MPNRLVVEELPDKRVQVGFRRTGQDFDEVSGEPVAFASPFAAAEREELRWYLEDYLIAPFAVYEQTGQAISAKLPEWGRALFEAVFGAGKPGRDAYLQSREGACELVLRSHSPAFLSLPWELLQDPHRTPPLALELSAIDRTLIAAGAAALVPPGEALRVLMVIARPAGLKDVGYQMIARPLLERLSAVRGQVELEVLRPPTLEALTGRLQAAAAAGEPYHILHFDGHGTFGVGGTGGGGQHQFDGGTAARGYLSFEAEGGGDDLVPAEEFALTVNQARVPLVVLNACRSGMIGEVAVEAAVATRLLEGGAASVVAMGYSVYAVAAAEFMTAFYEALFARKTVSEAVSEGRRRLYRRRERPSPKGMLPLEDWIVPVHYLRSTISFTDLKRPEAAGTLSLDVLLDRMRPSGSAATGGAPASDPLAPVGRFVGRDAAFYTLELALKWQRVVVVHGPAGTGKTELAKAFGRWWQATGGIENPAWVFFHSFEPGVASFGLDGVITAIGLQLFGPDFIGRTQDAAQRSELILQLLREHRMLLIWDNFESVRDLPDPTGATPPLDAAEQQRMRAFLAAVAQDGQSGVIVTSRTPETWLGDVRRVELGGLTPSEAAEMAEDVLRPYPAARAKRQERAFAELMEWLEGHPLSLRLLLPQLERVSAAALLAALQGKTAELPAGFVGEGRLASLGASLKYSFDHLTAEAHARVLALALFEGVADEDVLAAFSAAEGVPARFAGMAKEGWSELLRRLSTIGVLTELGAGMYGLHPALPSYLIAEWRRVAGESFSAEHAAAEQGLLAAYAGFGRWLLQQIKGGSAETALALLERQRRTMGRLLGTALAQQRYAAAQALMQPLDEFWDTRDLRQEARGWVDRCRSALEDRQGTPPDLAGEAGALWLFAVGTEANRAIRAGELDRAYEIYDTIRQKLEASPGAAQRNRLAVVYHELGRVVQHRGDLAAAEQWYCKSLEIEEALGYRPGMASSYHQLGILAHERGDLAAAEEWYRKSIEIKDALSDRPGLARSYHQLSIVAKERGDLAAAEQWCRKSLEVKEALGDRPGLARSYHQLGIVMQERGDLTAAEAWYRRSLEILEALGDRPNLAKSYHQLGTIAHQRGDLTSAGEWYQKSLEIEEALGNRAGMASSYHQLGIVARERGDLAAAEEWCQKSLEIEEAVGNRPGMAISYAQLGVLAAARGDAGEALDWTVRSVAVFAEFPHPATGSAPRHLARLTASLGMPALEASWQRYTGASLPAHVRTAVTDMLNAPEKT
jgi:tetratricopeptide (TPR) repeat protein